MAVAIAAGAAAAHSTKPMSPGVIPEERARDRVIYDRTYYFEIGDRKLRLASENLTGRPERIKSIYVYDAGCDGE